jgi:hypothetical protein
MGTIDRYAVAAQGRRSPFGRRALWSERGALLAEQSGAGLRIERLRVQKTLSEDEDRYRSVRLAIPKTPASAHHCGM